MRSNISFLRVAMAVSVPLLTAGCSGGGGGLFGSFGSGSSAEEVLSQLSSGNGNSSAGSSEVIISGSSTSGGSGGSGSSNELPGVATVHSPEPSSLTFSCAGLAALALLRRRKTRRA